MRCSANKPQLWRDRCLGSVLLSSFDEAHFMAHCCLADTDCHGNWCFAFHVFRERPFGCEGSS
jgi:hypothetical protein